MEVVEITPFTLETRLEPEVVRVLLVITVVVAIDPATLVVRTLPEVVAEVGTERVVKVALVLTKSVIVAVLEVRVLLTMLAREAVPVAVMLVPVAFPNNRLVMEAVMAFRISAKKLLVVALVMEALVEKRLVEVALVRTALVIVAEPKIGLSVKM
jgi:hypothetical protein